MRFGASNHFFGRGNAGFLAVGVPLGYVSKNSKERMSQECWFSRGRLRKQTELTMYRYSCGIRSVWVTEAIHFISFSVRYIVFLWENY